MTYNDVTLPEGTVLVLRADCANRDPEVFANPDSFITNRSNSKLQLTFGAGVHYCLGANLARIEMQEALPVLARGMADLKIEGEVFRKPYSDIIVGPDRLPLSFTASTR